MKSKQVPSADYTTILRQLVSELVAGDRQEELARILASEPFDYERLYRFDLQLGGPSLARINDKNRGRFDGADHDIFRPIQYVRMSYQAAQEQGNLEWYTRYIVNLSCGHIEELIKRISKTPFLPLGQALRSPVVRFTLPRDLWEQISQLVPVFNASKHEMSDEKDTHLFGPQDATMAYIVARLLGLSLYPFANLKTAMSIFDVDGLGEPED